MIAHSFVPEVRITTFAPETVSDPAPEFPLPVKLLFDSIAVLMHA
jgi:hypothetical protein